MKRNFDYHSYQKGERDGKKLGIVVGVIVGFAIMTLILYFTNFV